MASRTANALSTLDARLFAAIADHGGISAASRALGLQKSLVSRHLAKLEQALGVRLVQRTTRRVALTDAGRVLAAHARRAMEELQHAEAALGALSDTPRGVLRVTVPYAFLRFVLAPRLPQFQAQYPELRVAIDPTIRVLDLVQDGIDVAIRIGELADSSYVARELVRTPLVLVCSRRYASLHRPPATPTDLAKHALVALAPEVEGYVLPVAAHHERGRPKVQPSLAVGDPGSVLDLVASGAGIGVVPLLYAAPGLRRGSLVRVLPALPLVSRPIHVVYPSRRLLSPKVQAFVDFAADCAARMQDGAD